MVASLQGLGLSGVLFDTLDSERRCGCISSFFSVSSEIPDCKVVVHVSQVFTICLRFFRPSWVSPACTTYDLTVSFLSTTAVIHYFESFCTQIISSLLILVKVAD